MKAEKRTVFVVTHRMNVVQLADAVLVLSNGSIEAYGPRETVMQSLKRRVTPGASRVKALAGEEAA
jgi:ABC-type protease/lipase transport system fused ATPase/permease subunit